MDVLVLLKLFQISINKILLFEYWLVKITFYLLFAIQHSLYFIFSHSCLSKLKFIFIQFYFFISKFFMIKFFKSLKYFLLKNRLSTYIIDLINCYCHISFYKIYYFHNFPRPNVSHQLQQHISFISFHESWNRL